MSETQPHRLEYTNPCVGAAVTSAWNPAVVQIDTDGVTNAPVVSDCAASFRVFHLRTASSHDEAFVYATPHSGFSQAISRKTTLVRGAWAQNGQGVMSMVIANVTQGWQAKVDFDSPLFPCSQGFLRSL